MQIRRLAEAPHCLPPLAHLLAETWPDWYGRPGGNDAGRDLAERAGRTGIPLGLVALGAGGRPVGTVALGLTGHGAEPAEGPWLNGLAVAPDMRRQGIGGQLIAAAEAETARQGYPRLFAAAREAADLFRRRGWCDLRALPDGWTVLVRDPV